MNYSALLSLEPLNLLLVKNGLFVVDGALLIVANLLIVFAVLRHAYLREKKEYIIVAGKRYLDQIVWICIHFIVNDTIKYEASMRLVFRTIIIGIPDWMGEFNCWSISLEGD